MTMMTEQDYRDFTGDPTDPLGDLTIDGCLSWSEQKIQEYLGRYIAFGPYTEILEVSKYGRAYPAAVPVTEVAASADIEMIGDDCMQFSGFWPQYDFIYERECSDYMTKTVAYSGGFTVETAPMALIEAICSLTYYKAHTEYNPSDPQAHATQVRVGDVALGFDARSRRESLDMMVPGMTDLIRGLHLGRL